MTSFRLVVDGQSFEGWITAEVERSLDDFAQRFSLRYLDRWQAQTQPWPIRSQAACTLVLGDETLITGFVNRAGFHITDKDWQLTAEGRSRTGDLVDCSAIHATAHWKAKTATQIATDLCAPYNITVASDDDTVVFPRFALEEGESVHAALDRLCKVRALIPITTPSGDIKLIEIDPSASAAVLRLDDAIARDLHEDDSDRYSSYLLRAVGVGSVDEAFAKAASSDPGVKRFRPLVVIGDAPANTAAAQVRCTWEQNVRAGRSERVRYTMLGALALDGHTYKPGQLYNVRDDILGIDETLVVSRAVLRVSGEEFVTELELCRPQSYTTLAYTNKRLFGVTKRGKAIVKKARHGR